MKTPCLSMNKKGYGSWLMVLAAMATVKKRAALSSSMSRVTARATRSRSAWLISKRDSCRRMRPAEFPGRGTLGTTVAALLVCQSEAGFLWAGDSRVYRLRDGDLTLVTEDHNLAQERCRRGEVSQDAAQRLPSANVLTRAVGIHKDLRLEAHVAEIVAGDRYLISTDGLHKELTLETIRQMLSGPFNDQILQALIDEALNRGGRDNITGIVVDVGEQS